MHRSDEFVFTTIYSNLHTISVKISRAVNAIEIYLDLIALIFAFRSSCSISTLLRDLAGAHTPLEDGHWYTFRFTRRSGQLTVDVDGAVIFPGAIRATFCMEKSYEVLKF